VVPLSRLDLTQCRGFVLQHLCVGRIRPYDKKKPDKTQHYLFLFISHMWCLGIMRSKKISCDDASKQTRKEDSSLVQSLHILQTHIEWKDSEIRDCHAKLIAQQSEIVKLRDTISILINHESEHNSHIAKLEKKIKMLRAGGSEMCSACDVYSQQLQTITKRLEESLMCPIMKDLITDPVILPTTKTIVDMQAVVGSVIVDISPTIRVKCPFTRIVFNLEEVKDAHAVKEVLFCLEQLKIISLQTETHSLDARLTNALMSVDGLPGR